jgi:uroporphyrinogen-III synthase
MEQNRQTECDLTGIGVLVTRPESQATALCERITDHGGHAIPLPALTIDGPAQPKIAMEVLERVSSFALVIFISPNAVRYGLQLLAQRGLPDGIEVAAVGHGTARTLESHGITPSILPSQRFDSEALLELPQLQQLTGERVLIIRGNGGRPLLGDILQQRGATVEYAEVYRRECPDIDIFPLLNSWTDKVQIITATSNEILENLLRIAGAPGGEMLRSTPLVVISERMRKHASELGWGEIILAERASDEAIMEAVCSWCADRNNP